MSVPDLASAPLPAAGPLAIAPLNPENREAVVALATRSWDRSRNPATLAWRYEHCPSLEAAVGLAGGECVASIFGLRRSYKTSGGDVECLDVFDWMTTEQWRPLGAGLRVMKRLMSGPRPLLALGGAAAGQELVRRLGWRHLGTAERLVLPLTGRFLSHRGHPATVARAFDLIGGVYYAPRQKREELLHVEPAGCPGPAYQSILERQKRFALIARTDTTTLDWFRRAPAEMGLYAGFNLLLEQRQIGWAWARVISANGLRFADLQDLLLADDAREWYPAAVRSVTTALSGFGVDAIYSTTSCPDTLRALRSARFRLDAILPIHAWWPGTPPDGPVLVTSSHAEHAFFPCPTAAEAAWASPPS